MCQADMLRFDDTRLGARLPASDALPCTGDGSCDSLIRNFVTGWAGSEARIVATRADSLHPVDAGDVAALSGSVYARRLDDSRIVDLQIVARTRSGHDLIHTVQVELA